MKDNVFRIRIKQEILDKYNECKNDRFRERIRKYIERVINKEHEKYQILKKIEADICIANDPDLDASIRMLEGKTYGVDMMAPDDNILYHFFGRVPYSQYNEIEWRSLNCPYCRAENTWPLTIWYNQANEYQLKCRKCGAKSFMGMSTVGK